jgi:hypothetical protein
MLGLKKLQNTVSKALTTTPKVNASNSFMGAINSSEINDARKELESKRKESAELAYSTGFNILEQYKQNPEIPLLEQAGKKFSEALSFNSEHIPSIIMISFVLYALANEEMALKYMKMAEKLMPELPPDILKYKKAIEKRVAEKAKIK